MTPLTDTTRLTLAVALVTPCMAALWLMALPGTVSPSTYALFATLLLALAAIVLHMVRNGDAAGMGELVHATEVARRRQSRTRQGPAGRLGREALPPAPEFHGSGG